MTQKIRTVLFNVSFIISSVNSFSQPANLTGIWEGGLGQDDKAWVFGMTLNLTQVNNTISGTAKYVSNDGQNAYIIYYIKGEMNGNTISLNDISVKDENNLGGTWYWCKKIYFGKIIITGDVITLEGDWKNEGKKIFHNKQLLENTGVYCYPGNFRVSKAYEKKLPVIQETPKPPAATFPRTITQKTPSIFLNRRIDTTKTVEISGDAVKLTFYDNGDIDNDTITVYYNRQRILNRQRLTDKPLEIFITVEPNTSNELLMFADNEGAIPPNTALLVFDDDGKTREIRIDSNTKKSGAVIFHRK